MNAESSLLPAPLTSFAPATFLERGVRVPFTSPALVSACARPAERKGLELVLPNMSGGQGVYILPWESAAALCRPTMHDLMLVRRVSELQVITPSVLRRVARQIAAEGFAGRDAARAAQNDSAAEAAAAVATNFNLVLELVRQTEKQGPGWVPPERDRPANIERRAKAAIAATAARLDMRPDDLAVQIENLAHGLIALGIGPKDGQARVPRALASLDRLRREVAAFLAEVGGSEEARLLAETAALTHRATAKVLSELRAELADIPSLLRRWLVQPERLGQLIARPEWLLDGWERIWMLWDTQGAAAREETLADLIELLPIVPAEARNWAGFDIEAERHGSRHRRVVVAMEDWRSGIILPELVARNEQLRALSPGGPA